MPLRQAGNDPVRHAAGTEVARDVPVEQFVRKSHFVFTCARRVPEDPVGHAGQLVELVQSKRSNENPGIPFERRRSSLILRWTRKSLAWSIARAHLKAQVVNGESTAKN